MTDSTTPLHHYQSRDVISRGAVDWFGGVLPGLILCVLLVTFSPFSSLDVTVATAPTGDAVNQLGYSALGVISLAGVLMFARPDRALASLDLFWLLVIIPVLLVATLNSWFPAGSLRSLAFALIVMICCVAVVTIPRTADEMRRALLLASAFIMFLSYFGVIFLPSIATHQGDGFGDVHAGLWKGNFSHKNISGPVMAMLVFFGVYFMRAGPRLVGVAMVLLGILFVFKTGSKTTIGFMPLVIGLVLFSTAIKQRWIAVLIALTLIVIVSALTLGSVLFKPMAELAVALQSDPTYTGRTTIWTFAFEQLAKRPWTGYGFNGFWQSPFTAGSTLPFDAEWDYRTVVHGHNNYIDIVLMLGIPAGLLFIFAVVVRPLLFYLRAGTSLANRQLADLFAMIVIFSGMNSTLEKFWLNRDDPVWIITVVGIFGLRMTAMLPYPGARFATRNGSMSSGGAGSVPGFGERSS